MGKASINTSFGSSEGTIAKTPSTKGVTGTFGHNRPPFEKPHSTGKDTIPCKFMEGNEGKDVGPLTPNPEKFQTPMGLTLTSKGATDRKSRKSGS
jgi:hypothetical protein